MDVFQLGILQISSSQINTIKIDAFRKGLVRLDKYSLIISIFQNENNVNGLISNLHDLTFLSCEPRTLVNCSSSSRCNGQTYLPKYNACAYRNPYANSDTNRYQGTILSVREIRRAGSQRSWCIYWRHGRRVPSPTLVFVFLNSICEVVGL